MSAQMVEILILAIIAFLIISKLLSILGNTDEDDPIHKAGFFGEPGGLKDVTGKTEPVNKGKSNVIPLKPLITYSTDDKTNNIIMQIADKMPDFNPEKFIKGAKAAFQMVITALQEKDTKLLHELVDKRFSEELLLKEYKKDLGQKEVEVNFEDAYSFGNSIYIKVLINSNNFSEFWIFTRNINQSGPNWHLSNIEK